MTNPFDQFDFAQQAVDPFSQFDTLKQAGSDVPTPYNLALDAERVAKRKADMEKSLTDELIGLGEAALTVGTGAIAGTPVMAAATLKEIGESILGGNFGTSEAAQRAQEDVMQAASDVTYQPRTKAGQEFVKTLGEVAAPLAAFSAFTPQIMGVTNITGLTPKGQFTVKNITNKGRTRSIRQKLIADEIAKGNPEIKNILNAIDPEGNLINKKNQKALRKIVDEDVARNATITFDKMSNADKRKFNQMLDIVEKQRLLGSEYAITNRPSQIAGNSLANRIRALQKLRQKANKQLSQVLNKVGGDPVDIEKPLRDFIEKMQEGGVTFSVGDDGRIVSDFTNSRYRLGEILPKSEFDNTINRLNKGGFSAKDAHLEKQFLRELISYDTGQLQPTGVKQSKVISDAIKQLSNELGDLVNDISPEYEKANAKFSTVAEPINKASKMLKNFDLDSELTDNRAGQLARRLASDAITKDQVLDIIQSADNALAKNNIKFTDDILSQVSALALLDDVFNTSKTQSPFGFKSQISSAVGAVQGSPTTVVLGKAVEALTKLNEKDFSQKMKILRDVSKPKK